MTDESNPTEPARSTEDAAATRSDETASTDEAADPAPRESPSPRPRSAASRARRIGGAAAAGRPAQDAVSTTADTAVTTEANPKTTPSKRTTKSGSAAATTNTAATANTAAAAAAGATGDAEPASKPRRGRRSGGTPVSTVKRPLLADETPADLEPDADSPRRGTVTVSLPGWLRWLPGFAFLAVAIAFLALFVVARVDGDDSDDASSSKVRQEVLASAKTCLATLNTYRYNQIDAAEAAGVKCTTGKLTSDFKRTVTNVIGKNAPTLKAVQLAKINSAGIESVTKNGKQWTVLAYGQLNITTANLGKQGRVDPFAVVARLQQVDGEWLLSKIDTVSSLSP